MQGREEDAATALYEESVAMYEAAQENFDRRQAQIRRRLERGEAPTDQELKEEEAARARLFICRVRLSRREKHH
jgi:hypothetical protein